MEMLARGKTSRGSGGLAVLEAWEELEVSGEGGRAIGSTYLSFGHGEWSGSCYGSRSGGNSEWGSREEKRRRS